MNMHVRTIIEELLEYGLNKHTPSVSLNYIEKVIDAHMEEISECEIDTILEELSRNGIEIEFDNMHEDYFKRESLSAEDKERLQLPTMREDNTASIAAFSVDSDYEALKKGYAAIDEQYIDRILKGDKELTCRVPKHAKPGDAVLFLCRKTAKNNLQKVCTAARKCGDVEQLHYYQMKKEQYADNAGKIIAIGKICTRTQSDTGSTFIADATEIVPLKYPIEESEYSDFIKLGRGAVKVLDEQQWVKLRALIIEKNPDLIEK